jgi:hypothetical protein
MDRHDSTIHYGMHFFDPASAAAINPLIKMISITATSGADSSMTAAGAAHVTFARM